MCEAGSVREYKGLTFRLGGFGPGKDIFRGWCLERVYNRISCWWLSVSFFRKYIWKIRMTNPGISDWMHIWYSLQLIYFMPLRYYTYHKVGYQYFLADLV